MFLCMIKYNHFSIFGISSLPSFGDSKSQDNTDIYSINPLSKNLTLYIHIPFCKAECNFCKLRQGGYGTPNVPDEYVGALLKELKIIANRYNGIVIDSIYFGGGTPSLLNNTQLERILHTAIKNYNCSEDISISIEGDAHTLLNKDFIMMLSQNNVTKVSVGVQTFNKEMRKLLGRFDEVNEIFKVRDEICKFGIDDFNIDYMYNLPEIKGFAISDDLKLLYDLNPTSVDLQPLKYASCKFTFLQYIVNNKIDLPTSEKRINELESIRSNLNLHDYKEQYIGYFSNINRYESKYLGRLCGYHGGEYIGIGLGARSYIGDYAFKNTHNLKYYINKIKYYNEKPVDKIVYAPLSNSFIASFPKRGTRLLLSEVDKTTNPDYFHSLLNDLIYGGYVKKEEDCYKLTDVGINWYQNMQETLLSPDQKKRHLEDLKKWTRMLYKFNGYFHNIGGLI